MDHSTSTQPFLEGTGAALRFVRSLDDLTAAASTALDRNDLEAVLTAIEQRARLIEASGGAFERYIAVSRRFETEPLDAEDEELRRFAGQLHDRHLQLTIRLERLHTETARQLGRFDDSSRAADAYRSPGSNPAIDVHG